MGHGPSISSIPSATADKIVSAAQQQGIDPNVALAVAAVESDGLQYRADGTLVTSSQGAIGIMQVEPATARQLGFDPTNADQNIQAGVTYLAQQLDHYNGDYSLALAAYNSGPGRVNTYGGVPPKSVGYVNTVSRLANNAGSTDPTLQASNTLQSSNTPKNPTSPAANVAASGSKFTPTPASEVQGVPIDEAVIQSLTPQLQVDEGTDETPWYKDQGLITGNPRIRQQVNPVTFEVILDRNDNTKPQLQNFRTGERLVLQLNCSLREFATESRHIFTRTPSRTGQHITFWGMAPDLITGSGSTGVFMNQFGLTDYFSVSEISTEVKNLVVNGISHHEGNSTNDGDGIGIVSALSRTQNFNNIFGARTKDDANPNAAFRVAAQDAFIEFMSLFKMNGNIWFHSSQYDGFFRGQEQNSPVGWIPKTGASSFQQVARNNDVMTRGYVVMKFKNNTYLGYFKALSWTQDAANPFQWQFNFTFQVERTLTALYYPSR